MARRGTSERLSERTTHEHELELESVARNTFGQTAGDQPGESSATAASEVVPVEADDVEPAAVIVWEGLSADLLRTIAHELELADALALVGTCRSVCNALLASAEPWAAAHAAELGVCCSRCVDARALIAQTRENWLLRPGDCLEVRPTPLRPVHPQTRHQRDGSVPLFAFGRRGHFFSDASDAPRSRRRCSTPSRSGPPRAWSPTWSSTRSG